MARRTLVAAVVVALVAAACGGEAGPEAPPVGAVETSCSETACVDHPAGWDVEVGETYLAFRHPDDPERVVASVGDVDMAALVETVGGEWPAPPRAAIEAFWDLIGGGEDASLDGIETRDDGAIRSEGELEGLRMWHLLVPGFARTGIGVEVRAPNDSWEAHADVFLGSLRRR
ncbi:MAG: hypothetical protein R3290_12035 [Acidimicrobiia bacterium]|nr:hypothetical protein [Acidimicrobiia bacterium]